MYKILRGLGILYMGILSDFVGNDSLVSTLVTALLGRQLVD